jgi:hypothetical protein
MEATSTTQPARASNLKTALVLASIALVFFAGVIINHWYLQ